jgi:1-acyl-sn-glycerol-3-phosphate acyltransferase
MRDSLSYLRSLVITCPMVILLTVLFGSWSLIVSLFDRGGVRQHRVARLWARSLMWVCRVRVTVHGLEHLDPEETYVLAVNHRSYLDIPVLLPNIPIGFRFLAKRSLFGIPFLGHHLKTAGHLPVIFDDPRASLRSMKEAARIIADHRVSVVIFPEGGRTHGELRDFKEGLAYIAIQAGVPIAPVGITGLFEALPMGSVHIRGRHVTMRFGAPIPTSGLVLKDRTWLTQLARERVGELCGQPVNTSVS